MKSLFLIRGLPGSGKTTVANVLSENGKYPVFSIDDYFTNKDTGAYAFIHTENHKAYSLCEENTKRAMQTEAEKIFVHNTFTMEWETTPYFRLAEQFGYRVFVLTMENYHGGRNTHGIGEEQLAKMAEKYKVKLM